MTDPWTPIVAYCERSGPGLWAEPLNAVTNLAFILAAASILTSDRGRAVDRWLLGGLMLAVGAGSGLFHTLAVRWASVADVVPIVCFVLFSLWFALVHVAVIGRVASACVVVIFVVASPFVASLASGVMGGSAAYLPAFLAIVAVAAVQLARARPGGGRLLLAAAVFAVSLAARMADRPFCAVFPPGTHFLWHFLNAGVLWLVASTILAAGPAPVARRRPQEGRGVARS